jgi:hypothetical protein
MTRFKLLHAVAILSILIATEAQAHGIDGREVAAPPWSAACMTDQGPSVCGEPMWVYGPIGDHAGKKTALSPELKAPHRNGVDKPHVNWPANLILG